MRIRKMYRSRVGVMFEADFVGTRTDPSGVVTTYVLDTEDEEPLLRQNEDTGGEEAYTLRLPDGIHSFVLDDPYDQLCPVVGAQGPTIGEVLKDIEFERFVAKLRRT